MSSIFGRIKDLVSANVNAMLDNAEDPERMANEYIRQLNDQLYETKTNVAAAMADETKLHNKMVEFQAQVDSWQAKAEAALRAGDEGLAKAALSRKVEATKMAEQYQSQFESQDQQVEQLQAALVQLESRLSEVKAKKELIIAKKNRAATQEAIQRASRGVSEMGALDKLDRLEERVDDQLAQAEAMAKLEGDSLENKFKDLEKDSAVDSELAELKRKMGMA